MKCNVMLAVAILLSVGHLVAQEKPAIHAEIRMLAFTPDLEQEEVYAHDPAVDTTAVGIQSPIKTYLNHQFTALELKSRKIVFTSKTDRASLTRDGETVGEVTLPEGANSAILLVLPGKPGARARCQILTISDSKSAFPSGCFHVTNLSPLPVKMRLEQKDYDFKPGGTVLIKDPPVREGNQIGMRTFVFKNSDWEPIATGLWPHPGQNRSVLVLFQNPTSGDVQLRAFDDSGPRAAQPSAAAAP